MISLQQDAVHVMLLFYYSTLSIAVPNASSSFSKLKGLALGYKSLLPHFLLFLSLEVLIKLLHTLLVQAGSAFRVFLFV